MEANFFSILTPKKNRFLLPGDYNLAVVIHFTSLVGFAGHFLFIFLFLWLGVKQMALLNIGSCILFMICFWLNQHGYLHLSLLLGSFEVGLHAVLAVAFVGWESGFHYYILGLTPLIFYSQSLRLSTKLLSVSLLCGVYIALNSYALSTPAWVVCSSGRLRVIGVVNIITLFIVFSALAYYYRLAATNAEKNLTQVNLKLEEQAYSDSLTHLANRRNMQEKIEAQAISYLDSREPFCIIISDIDDFKKYNDTYGHDTGDLILVKITELLIACMREHDQVGRWGGEEFLVLLPETRQEGALLVAERIRERVEVMRIPISPLESGVTMTFGIAEFNDASTPAECITRADLALYEGKRRGKNCVQIYQKV
jgi:diguanylate cyclase (GGDEF)-like protein